MFPVNYIELVERYDSGETLIYIFWWLDPVDWEQVILECAQSIMKS